MFKGFPFALHRAVEAWFVADTAEAVGMLKRTASRTSPVHGDVCELVIRIKEIRPSIWRRVRVSSDITLRGLHDVIQDSLGWTDSHLHQFTIRGKRYGFSDDELGDGTGESDLDDRAYRLCDLVKTAGTRFAYDYDFGDFWQHEIVVESIGPSEPKERLPRCVEGARACPPEDVGSTTGYRHFVAVMKNASHPERAALIKWNGGVYDAERFDLEEVNRVLKFTGRRKAAGARFNLRGN